MTIPYVYATGTISVNAAGTAVTGVGTVWQTVGITRGDTFIAAGLVGIVESVTDNTHLTLSKGWPGAVNLSGVSYEIVEDSPERDDLTTAQRQLTQFVNLINGVGVIYYVVDAAPSSSLGDDGQFALKTNSSPWKFWLKSGGVWVEQSTPAGISTRGTYAGGTTYEINDLVSYGGNAWLSLQTGNIGHQPDISPSWWSQITGLQGADGRTVLSGSGAPGGGLGVDGDFYINTTAHTIYGPKTGGAWGSPTSLIGPTGSTGPQGNPGPQGDPGDPGDPGSPGPAAWTTVSAWASSTAYVTGPPASVVTFGGETYVCNTGHTSQGTFAADASKWTKVAAKGVDGAGAGDMLKSVYDPNDDGLIAAAQTTGLQPLDSDLTAIAALTTAAYGRSLLTLADGAALAGEVDSYFLTPTEGNAAYQPLDADLTTLAALGNWKIAYTDGSGNQTALTVGAVGTALCGNGVTSAPSWQGVCLTANNLSDVAAATTARQNLGIYKHGSDVASAGTTNLNTATGDLVDVTGTTTITAITLSDGVRRWVRFTGALTLTNGASLVLPTGANIVTVAGDYALFVGYAAGVVRCAAYLRNSGAPLTDALYAKLAGNQNLTGGHTATAYDAGTKSSGTFTPDPTLSTWQKFTDNGAFTLAPQTTGTGDSSSMIIDQTNGASAGTITRSGWTKVTGDALTTTNGNKFRHYCTVSTAGSHIHTQAL